MARIKVTGYLDVHDLEPDELDLGNPMGISEKAYVGWAGGMKPLPTLDDVEFELEEDE